MSKFGSLLKTQLNSRFGFSMIRYALKNDRKAIWKGLGIGLAILVALGQFVFMYTFLLTKMFEAAKILNAPQLIITLGAVGSGLLTLFLGVFYILGALFLAKDTEFLASLPIRQGSIFASKFIMVMIGEYPLVLFMMLPPVIIYGTGTGQGVLFYLVALLCMLLLPLAPLVVSSVLSLGLMRLVSRSRRRDLITIIGSIILTVAVMLGPNYLFARLPDPESGRDIFAEMLSDSNGLVAILGRLFPPSVWITRALSLTGGDAFINLVYLVLLSAAAFGLVYVIASFIYLRGASAHLEAGKKTGKTRIRYRRSSPVGVMFKIEWKTILRTPIYALNSLIIVFIGPVIMCMPLLGGNFAQDPDLKALFSLIENSSDSPLLILILAGVLTLFAMINPAVSSSISREGKSVWMLKNIPVAPASQVMGKFAAGYSISFISILATSVVMAVAFKVGWTAWIASLVISAAALVPICAFGLLVDLVKPKLNWTNAQEAIKQNMNVMLGMLIGLLFIAVYGVMGYALIKLTNSSLIIYSVFLAILAATAALSVSILRKTAATAFQKIEA
jgi:ABC-2 type transport system permease protein